MATTLERVWYRPALMILTDQEPTENNAVEGSWNIGTTAGTDYIFLTDDNRSPLGVTIERIEFRKRMINGRMRTYHVVDKKSFSVSWSELPSSNVGISEYQVNGNQAWASGKKMKEWYDDHNNSFWLLLIYDTPDPEGTGNIPLRYKIEKYNVFFESFDYTISKRGSMYDHWEVSMALVEA
jgi:hypothetical protein